MVQEQIRGDVISLLADRLNMPASSLFVAENNERNDRQQPQTFDNQQTLQLAIELSQVLGLKLNDSPLAPNVNDPQWLAHIGAQNIEDKSKRNMTECVAVPSSEHVAEIVGRQGCKIKSLRAKTNTYIKTPVRGEEPVFVVTGRAEDVQAAKSEILSAAEHFSQIRACRKHNVNGSQAPGPPAIPGQMTIEVKVPYRVVGLVVGPKGATIKRIQQTTSTYIVTPSRDKEPVFEVTGLPDNVQAAKKEIEQHIASRTGIVESEDSQLLNALAASGNLDAFENLANYQSSLSLSSSALMNGTNSLDRTAYSSLANDLSSSYNNNIGHGNNYSSSFNGLSSTNSLSSRILTSGIDSNHLSTIANGLSSMNSSNGLTNGLNSRLGNSSLANINGMSSSNSTSINSLASSMSNGYTSNPLNGYGIGSSTDHNIDNNFGSSRNYSGNLFSQERPRNTQRSFSDIFGQDKQETYNNFNQERNIWGSNGVTNNSMSPPLGYSIEDPLASSLRKHTSYSANTSPRVSPSTVFESHALSNSNPIFEPVVNGCRAPFLSNGAASGTPSLTSLESRESSSPPTTETKLPIGSHLSSRDDKFVASSSQQ